MEGATGELDFSILFNFNKVECEYWTVKYVSLKLCCFLEGLFSFPIAAMIHHQKFCSLEIIPVFSLSVLETRSLMWVLAATIRMCRVVSLPEDYRRTSLLAVSASGGCPHSWLCLPLSSKAVGLDPSDSASMVRVPSGHKWFFRFRDNCTSLGRAWQPRTYRLLLSRSADQHCILSREVIQTQARREAYGHLWAPLFRLPQYSSPWPSRPVTHCQGIMLVLGECAISNIAHKHIIDLGPRYQRMDSVGKIISLHTNVTLCCFYPNVVCR